MNQYSNHPDEEDPSVTQLYRVAVYGFTYGYLGLNYNQATTKCTIYPFESNSTYDYEIVWHTGTYGYYLLLNERTRFLGACGGSNDSQCYWYLGTHHQDDNWFVYPVS